MSRPPSKPPPNPASPAGNPTPLRQLPTRAEIGTLMAGDRSTVDSADRARQWLESKGWILDGEPYDRTKLVRVLMTVAISLTNKSPDPKPDAKNAILSVAYLLEDDVMDSISDTLVEAVAAKTLGHIEAATEKLTSSANFVVAIDNRQAETTLAIKTVSDQLVKVSTSLELLTTRLAVNTPPPPPRSSWAAVAAKANASLTLPSLPSNVFNPTASNQQTIVQQRVLRAARKVLVEVDPKDDSVSLDRTPAGLNTICGRMNKEIADLETSLLAHIISEDEGTPEITDKTHIRGITSLERGGLLFELDSADSALRFRQLALDDQLSFLTGYLGETAKFKAKPHNLIIRFVPCTGEFNPSDPTHLRDIENDVGLPPETILSAAWLKPPSRRGAKQTLASIKMACSDADTANTLIQERVFIAGHLVVIRKDFMEPTRCNKCQLYGHIRNACKGKERCATCASEDHPSSECPTDSPHQCVSCGPDSTHPSSSRGCPAFKKRCNDLETRFPENSMPYFPTGETWTWAVNPPKLSTSPPTHHPRIPHDPPAPASNTHKPNDCSRNNTMGPPAYPTASCPPSRQQAPSKSQTLPPRSQSSLDNYLATMPNPRKDAQAAPTPSQ